MCAKFKALAPDLCMTFRVCGILGYAAFLLMTKTNKNNSSLRVIAGQWRGRKIRFDAAGTRPTGDRVRETLFNWLAPFIRGAHCLDLYAGSGALGIEALSRGAKSLVAVERNRSSAKLIEQHLQEFGAIDAEVLIGLAERIDLQAHGPFDLVFLDPPFDGPSLADLCTLLENSGGMAEQCLIYLEMSRDSALPGLPAEWQLLREKTAGKVRYALAERQRPQGSTLAGE